MRRNLERRGLIVEALQGVNTKACADLLFAELKRVKKLQYHEAVLGDGHQVRAGLHALELIQEGFTSLANDNSFSYKMRAKFEEAIIESRYPEKKCY